MEKLNIKELVKIEMSKIDTSNLTKEEVKKLYMKFYQKLYYQVHKNEPAFIEMHAKGFKNYLKSEKGRKKHADVNLRRYYRLISKGICTECGIRTDLHKIYDTDGNFVRFGRLCETCNNIELKKYKNIH